MSEIRLLEASILGVVQGATEFLPISSSAHLVISQDLLGLKNPELLFDVILHGATLLAVLLVYWRDLCEIARQCRLALGDIRAGKSPGSTWQDHPHLRLAAFLAIGTVPAALSGLFFEGPLEKLFGSPSLAAAMLLVTGAILFLTRFRTARGRNLEHLTVQDSVAVGIAQSVALVPGISRSGATIACGIFWGLDRDLAARFSFLLSIPAILGANLLHILKIGGSSEAVPLVPFLTGGLAAFTTGYLALRLLLRIVHRGNISLFSYYCWAVGLASLWHFLAARSG